MTEDNTIKIHWSYWVIGIITLLYNLAGVMNFITQMNPDNIAAMPEAYRALIETRPAWATAAFALAVFGGALGCIVLLLRKAAAFHLFIAALLGAIATMLHALGITGADANPAAFLVGNLVQLAVTIFLIWYASWASRKGWLR